MSRLRFAAFAPGYWLFAGALVVIGVAALIFMNATNSLIQRSTEPPIRGRIIALRIAIFLGGTPIGAPIAGWVADPFGPRLALRIGAASGFAAAVAAGYSAFVRKGAAGRLTPAIGSAEAQRGQRLSRRPRPFAQS